MALYAFPDSAPLASLLAKRLGEPARRLRTHRFPDGESLVLGPECAADRAVLLRSLHAPDAKLFETLLAVDALRRAGARQVTLLAPYLPYMRQDEVFHPGEPLSQRVLAQTLGRAVDGVLTVEAHLHRIASLQEVFPCRAESLSAAAAIAEWVRRRRVECVVGPDRESRPWVEAIADAAGVAALVGEKERLSDRRVRVRFPRQPSWRSAVLVDDVGSSGGTLATAASALRRRGVLSVDAVVVHALFAPGALERLARAGIRQVVSCNTIPHRTNRIDVTPALASALGRWCRGAAVAPAATGRGRGPDERA